MIVVISSSGGSSGGSACNDSGCRESYSCFACLFVFLNYFCGSYLELQ